MRIINDELFCNLWHNSNHKQQIKRQEYSEGSRHEKHKNFWDVLCQCLSALCAKGREEGRSKEEVDEIIFWLTGYDETTLQQQLDSKVDFETFFDQAPQLNSNVSLITGVICGYRVEEIEDKLMQKVRYLDKLIDELAKGKAMEKILRK